MNSDGKRRIRTVLVTGQSNQWHNWRTSHAALAKLLRSAGLFDVTVAVSPASGEEMSGFAVDWSDFDLAVIDYEGDSWPEKMRSGFERFVSNGGGVVIYHAADNAFPDWPAYNEMIAVGGWGGRDEGSGPMLRWRDGEAVRDPSPGEPYHPAAYSFAVTTRAPEHPVMRGLPAVWRHANDEMYSKLRGPAKNVTILATARADPAEVENGSGENEPMLMAIGFGKGRVFHTTLGHVGAKDESTPDALRCVGFATTFLRGAEWAATGEVTQPVPADYPGPDDVRLR